MSTAVNAATFYDTASRLIEDATITSCQRMDEDTFMVSYFTNDDSERMTAKVSYTTYCILRPYEQRYIAALNATTDAHQ